jgi:hypothetical protein
MIRLAYGQPATAHSDRSCNRCGKPLYSQQPIAVERCTARELRGCQRICRPDESCATVLGEALHVGCAVLGDNTVSSANPAAPAPSRQARSSVLVQRCRSNSRAATHSALPR